MEPRNFSCFDSNLSRNSVTPEYWNSLDISDDLNNSTIFLAVALFLFLLVGLPSNVIIIVSIIQQNLYREPTHILLLNLAISDFLLCLLLMPLGMATGFASGYVLGDSDYVRCQVCQTGLVLTALTLIAVYILCLLSVDRFIFIKFPLRYNRYVTVPRVLVLVTLSWILAISLALLPLSGFGEIRYAFSVATCVVSFIGRSENIYYAIILVGQAIIPILITIVINIWIACTVRKKIKIVYKLRTSLYKAGDLSAQKQLQKRKKTKQFALVRVFGVMVLTNFIVWTPMVILTILLAIIEETRVPIWFYTFSYLSFFLHSILHPLIEGCFIPEIKMTFKNILGIR